MAIAILDLLVGDRLAEVDKCARLLANLCAGLRKILVRDAAVRLQPQVLCTIQRPSVLSRILPAVFRELPKGADEARMGQRSLISVSQQHRRRGMEHCVVGEVNDAFRGISRVKVLSLAQQAFRFC